MFYALNPPPKQNYEYIPNCSNLIVTTLTSLLWQNNMAHLFLSSQLLLTPMNKLTPEKASYQLK